MPSLSRQLAHWVHDLRYEDLPPEVIDRVKGLNLHALASALVGIGKPAGKEALAIMKDEEAGGPGVATVMVDGSRMTKGGAAYVNAELIVAGGKWDSYRMISHPGRNVLPTAFATAETEGTKGRDFITAVAAAYEVLTRMARNHLPSTMARGFHAAPIYGMFGATVAPTKLLGFNEDQINAAINHAVNLAAGNVESTVNGGSSTREGGVVRNALLAVAIAKHGGRGSGESGLDGQAGFYNSFTGSNKGKLSVVFTGAKNHPLEEISDGLGKQWVMLDTVYRIYSTGGFNNPHIEVGAAMAKQHNIKAADIDRIETTVNWLEREHPSPVFVKPPERFEPNVGSTQYFSAVGIADRGLPMLAAPGAWPQSPAVLDLMKRVTLIPSKSQAVMAPTITVFMKDGKRYRRKASGKELIWDFDEEARRIRDVVPGIPIAAAQFEQLIDACRNLDKLPRANELVKLTVAKK